MSIGAATGAASTTKRTSLAPSDVSDVEDTKGALKESNALNDEGVRILAAIAAELEHRLSEATQANEEDAFSKGRVPKVAVDVYLARLARYINVWRGHAGGKESAGVRSAVMTMVYIDKIEKMRPGYALTRQNVHRLAMSAMLISTKFMEDRAISTEFWAKVGGVSLPEVNSLESKFCSLLDFELFVDEEVYDRYLEQFNVHDSDSESDSDSETA